MSAPASHSWHCQRCRTHTCRVLIGSTMEVRSVSVSVSVSVSSLALKHELGLLVQLVRKPRLALSGWSTRAAGLETISLKWAWARMGRGRK